MNKKGFTLVELLAIIIILSLIFALSYPKIVEQLNKSEQKIDKYTEDLIFSAANRYINGDDKYIKDVGRSYCIKIEDLDKEGLIPIDIDKYRNKYLKVKIGKNKNYIEILNSCKELYAENAEIEITLKSSTGGGITPNFYKTVTMEVKFKSEATDLDYYYIKTTTPANQNNNMITHKCGSGVDPNECSSVSTSVMEPNYWYRVKGTLDLLYNTSSIDNHTLYAVIYNGKRYLQMKTATIPPLFYYANQFSYTNSINNSVNNVEAAITDLKQRYK